MILRPLARISRATLPLSLASVPTKRTFTSLPLLRPTLARPTLAITRPSALLAPTASTPCTGASASMDCVGGAVLDLIPREAISRHPALLAMQIRCGPRPTMSGHTRLIQKRRHGFLNRNRTRNGKKTLLRRRIKGRKRLAWG